MFNLAVYICKYLFVFIAIYFQYINISYIYKMGASKKREFSEAPVSLPGKTRFKKGLEKKRKKKHGYSHEADSFDVSGLANRQFVLLSLFHVVAFCILYNGENIILGAGGLVFFNAAFLAVKLLTKRSCPLLWNNVFMLMDTGFIMLLRINADSAERQLMWFAVGLVAAVVCFNFLRLLPKGFVRNNYLPFILLFLTLAFLVLPFFLGKTINGANNWISVFGYSFQPSELAKIAFVLCLAGMLRNIERVQRDSLFRVFLLCAFSAACVLILVVQRDLGGALIFFVTFVVVLYDATGNKILVPAALVSASGAAVVAYNFFPHIRVRVAAWLNPWNDIDSGGYQILQSLFAMGTWGPMGSGLSLGLPTYIPVVESDFIFAAITEEFGVFFALLLICSFVFILFFGIRTAIESTDKTKALTATGLTSLIAFQTFLIIGGCIKLIPITGVTLPFVSYGGSSVVVCLIIVSMLAFLSLPDAEREEDEPETRYLPDAVVAAVASMFDEEKAPVEKPVSRTPFVLGVFFVLYGLNMIFLCKFVFFDSDEIAANSYNPRVRMSEADVRRGDIYDRSLKTLVSTDENSVRNYAYAEKTAHVTGYSDRGGTGAELRYNFELQRIGGELFQRIASVFSGKQAEADSIVLTIDADLTSMIYDRLAATGFKSSAVVMEPSTGRVLAIASYPSYNPNKISEYWLSLSADTDNSPLLNRATQGLYPPGSVFKIITAAAMVEEMGFEHFDSYVHECFGEEMFPAENGIDERIRCFDQRAHGQIGLPRAFALSCNTFFSSGGLSIGGSAMKKTAEKALFNSKLQYPLSYSLSSFELTGESNVHDIVQTSIGQGKTLVTPLHMAMLTSAVANGGILMQPYVRDYVLSRGQTIKRTAPKKLADVFKPDEAALLTQMMADVIKSGTGTAAAVSGVTVAGKTGTAENSSGDDHGWIVAFAPAENPKVALAIMLENSDGPRKALPIAKEIIEWVLESF